jgi:hypothetical protein
MGHPTKYDDTLFSMMQQHDNEMEFLNTIFGFLQRKSSCFNGPKVDMPIARPLALARSLASSARMAALARMSLVLARKHVRARKPSPGPVVSVRPSRCPRAGDLCRARALQ